MRTSKLAFVTSLLLLAAACGGGSKEPPAPAVRAGAKPAAPAAAPAVDRSMLGAFGQLPARIESPDNPLTDAKVTLGRTLFHDPRFSLGQRISCNTCHALDSFGDDGRPHSLGHEDHEGGRNAPTVYNAAGHVAQFWDGRAPTVEEQAKGPVLNPIEMAMPDEAYVLRVLHSIPGYADGFAAAFPGQGDPITYDNFGRAIGAFERLLVTPSRWDAFQAGDDHALTDAELAGFKTFNEVGCSTCHFGPYVGGALYQKLGLVRPWPDQSDLGRYEITKNDADKMFFKVPSLRNTAETAPYFHSGQVATLDEAIKLMGAHQLGKDPTDAQVASIATFVRALTGTPPADLIPAPALPSSGPDTPGPGGA